MENSSENINDIKFSDYEHDIDVMLLDEKKYKFRKAVKETHAKFIADSGIKPKIKFIKRHYIIYSIAASIVLLIGIGSIIKYGSASRSYSYEILFNEYYQPYKSDYNTRSDENVVSNLYLAFQLYERKEYDKAIEFFSKVTEEDHTILIAYFYKGVSCIEIADYKRALDSFNKVLKSDSNPYYPQAHWYSSLTWIKLNNAEQAKDHLNWLIANDRFYGAKAKELISKMD